MNYLELIDEIYSDGNKHILNFSPIKIDSIVCSSDIHTVLSSYDEEMDCPLLIRISKGNAGNLGERVRLTQTIAKIRSENLPRIYKLVNKEHYSYIIMEPISGISLKHRLSSGSIDEKLALRLALPLARTLVKVWEKGLHYKFLNPSLIKLNSHKEIIIEFPMFGGIFSNELPEEFIQGSEYHSPELLRGSKTDFRSDAWSFGAILFEAFTGRNYNEDSNICLDESLNSCELSISVRKMLKCLLSDNMEDRITQPVELNKMMQDCLLSLEIFDANKLKDDTTSADYPNNDIKTQQVDLSGTFKQLPKIGQEIGNCILKELVGEGGFGYVYKAYHKILDIELAIKILDPKTRTNDPISVAMFLREARIAASINHPNIINTFESGQDGGYYYLIMEYMNGGNLKDHISKVGLSYNCLAKVLLALSNGLSAIEQLKIVHRDIKPANIMFSSNNEEYSIKIADMGLAKRLDLSNADNQITQNLNSESINGSPAYMAPEMILTPDQVDIRADIYSLGATAYHVVTGEPVFEGTTSAETIMSHIQKIPIQLSELKADIPPQLEYMIMKMLEKNPQDRYQSASELIVEIENFINHAQKSWSMKKFFNMALAKFR